MFVTLPKSWKLSQLDFRKMNYLPFSQTEGYRVINPCNAKIKKLLKQIASSFLDHTSLGNLFTLDERNNTEHTTCGFICK